MHNINVCSNLLPKYVRCSVGCYQNMIIVDKREKNWLITNTELNNTDIINRYLYTFYQPLPNERHCKRYCHRAISVFLLMSKLQSSYMLLA